MNAIKQNFDVKMKGIIIKNIEGNKEIRHTGYMEVSCTYE